jgi:acyl-CoA synthetase (AMP-forming)/AMP-acid ligase II
MTPAWGLAENVTLATCHPIDRAPVVETISGHVLNAHGVAAPVDGEGVRSVAIGRSLPRHEVEVRGPEGEALEERSVGTIWIRSPCLFSGYHRESELTASVFVDGWLNTGDRGYLVGADLYFVSREKDVIVVGGEKYSPHHIEAIVNRVRGVRAGCAVVFGVLDVERGTEEVAAVVETREEGERARKALEEAIGRETRLATGLILRYVILVPPGGVQKTTSGKLARAATRRRWMPEIDGLRAGASASR